MTHKKVLVAKLPQCDFCDKDAQYDGKTWGGPGRSGPWANMCRTHFKLQGVGLGLGRGQELVLAQKPKKLAMTFDAWMNKVDAILVGLCGMTSEDLPDQLYGDKYAAGQTPGKVAKATVAYCKKEYGF